MSHAHPDFSLGGGEIAAYNLFKAYKQSEKVESVWFLARADRGRGPTGQISKRRDNEYLWEQAVHDWHNMKAVHAESVTTWFVDLIKALKPTVVHTHHYAHLGLEYLQVIKQVDPKIKIMLTLHEYMAICTNNGQMVKTGSFKLCNQSSPDDCHRCFPEKSPEDFWLRKHRFMRYFDLVDQFISPSEFLRQRYIDWGLPSEKIAVIENGQSDEPPLPPRVIDEGETRNRFGFFGQINPYKGLDVLLEAINLMSKADKKKIVLEIHGANLELQPKEYQEKIERLLKPLRKQGIVQWIGPYQPHELRSRMANIDWVCVPSIWWENSPMIIQEAFSCGRPLLVSNIGGMSEKIVDGINGFYVLAGNANSWATQLASLINTLNEETYLKYVDGIPRPINHTVIVQKHLEEIYAGLSK
jgi:glycosyltransferase involved in cell wall biosynthesis